MALELTPEATTDVAKSLALDNHLYQQLVTQLQNQYNSLKAHVEQAVSELETKAETLDDEVKAEVTSVFDKVKELL